MTSSRLSVADVAGEVPRIAARAVLANFPFFFTGRGRPQTRHMRGSARARRRTGL